MLNLCTTTFDAYTPSIATLHGGAGCINTTHLRADSGLSFGLQNMRWLRNSDIRLQNMINRPAVHADLRQLRTDGKQYFADRHDTEARHTDLAALKGDLHQLESDWRAPAPATAEDLQNLKFSVTKALNIAEKTIPVGRATLDLYKSVKGGVKKMVLIL